MSTNGKLKRSQNPSSGKRLRKVRERHDSCFTICGNGRFEIIGLIRAHPEGLRVSDIAKRLNRSVSSISHQLAVLREHKVATVDVQGRNRVYSIPGSRMRKYLPCWTSHS
jgi:DNA-binding transcriptional ArsR family regulator